MKVRLRYEEIEGKVIKSEQERMQKVIETTKGVQRMSLADKRGTTEGRVGAPAGPPAK